LSADTMNVSLESVEESVVLQAADARKAPTRLVEPALSDNPKKGDESLIASCSASKVQ
jgi:hypothetical protein